MLDTAAVSMSMSHQVVMKTETEESENWIMTVRVQQIQDLGLNRVQKDFAFFVDLV